MVKGNKTSKEEPTGETAKEFTVEAPQLGIKETSEKDSEDSSEDLKKPVESEESSEDSEDSSDDSKESVELGESSKDSEKSSDDSSESNDSENPQPPAGITDEELSRVFGSLPKKSKVALNRAESKMSSVKNAKSSPVWYPWVFSIIMIIGLIWAVVYYLTGTYPIPHIGVWNLCIAFVTMLVGFSMTMFWK
jgi:cobalamin biosynthesis Mg chelatase CobN